MAGLNYTAGSADNNNMKMRRSISVVRHEGGMTMIELSMAAIIILGAVVVMMAMFDTSIDILRYTTSRSLATQVANQAVEDMRAMDYAQVVVSKPTSWPVDPYLDASDPPNVIDIDDFGAETLRPLFTTDTAVGLQIEEMVERQRITFIIHRYVMLVDDGASDAFKRLMVRVEWLKTPVEGDVIISTNFSRDDKGESRPLLSILGIRSTHYDYFANATLETTMGTDGSVRGGPFTTSINPDIWTEAVVTGAKANYMDRVEFKLYDPDGNKLVETEVTSTSINFIEGRYFVWRDFNSKQYDDDTGYLVRAEAFDNLGRSDVDALRFNIDNDPPPPVTSFEVTLTVEAPMMFRLAWEWEPGADEVPALSRFMITKKRNGGGAGDTTTTITQNLLPAPAERSFLDPISSGALSARNYHYRYEITAIDSAGNLSPPISSGRLKKTTLEATDTVGPVIVSSISGEPVSWNTAELSWPQTTDDVEMGGYQLWSRQGNIWGVVATTTDTVTDPVFHRDPQLFSGREYWYTVWAFDAVGNRVDEDPYNYPWPGIYVALPMR